MTIFTTPVLEPPRLRAVQAILVYEDRSHPQGHTDCALTTHRIEHTEHGVRIGPGRLFGQEDQQALLDILLGALTHESAFLPSEIVSHGSAQLAWCVPGRVRPMWVRFNGKETHRLNVPWPTLLFCVHRGNLRLAALARPVRPDADTPLYHAPLMNVHDHTGVCTGSAVLPTGCSLGERAGFEAAVFDTNFTHVNHAHTLVLRGGAEVSTAAHLRFWRTLESQARPRFPPRALVPLQQSVSEWLSRAR